MPPDMDKDRLGEATFYSSDGTTYKVITSLREIETLAEEMQIEFARVKHGKWIPGREISRDYIGDTLIDIRYENQRCSNCNCIVEDYRKPTWNYCPNCGAKMDLEGEQND